MGKEILAIPEQNLPEVIRIIRAGIGVAAEQGWLSEAVAVALYDWCDEGDEHLTDAELEEG